MRAHILVIAFVLASMPGLIGHRAKERGESLWVSIGRALIALLGAEAVLASELGEAPAVLSAGEGVLGYSQAEYVGFVLLALALVSFTAGWHLAGTKLKGRLL